MRQGQRLTDVDRLRLAFGDTLLVQGKWESMRALRRDRLWAFRGWWLLTMAMGTVFLVGQAREWIERLSRHGFAELVRLMAAEEWDQVDQIEALWEAPAVAASLVAFAIVYFLVFGAGVFYLLRLMRGAPAPGERGPKPSIPTPAAGLMPGPAMKSDREDGRLGQPAGGAA